MKPVLRVYSWATDAKTAYRRRTQRQQRNHFLFGAKRKLGASAGAAKGGPHPPTGYIHESQRLRGRIRVAQDQSPGFSLRQAEAARHTLRRVICDPAPRVACTTRPRRGPRPASRAESHRRLRERSGAKPQRDRHRRSGFPLESGGCRFSFGRWPVLGFASDFA